MHDNLIVEELRVIKQQILAEHGGDHQRVMEAAMQRQYLRGWDLYGRSKETGRIEIVFKAPRS